MRLSGASASALCQCYGRRLSGKHVYVIVTGTPKTIPIKVEGHRGNFWNFNVQLSKTTVKIREITTEPGDNFHREAHSIKYYRLRPSDIRFANISLADALPQPLHQEAPVKIALHIVNVTR